MSDTGNAGSGDGGKPPEPPASQGQGDNGDKAKPPSQEDVEGLKSALNEERKARREWESKYSKLEKEHMSDQEKLIAQAKDEGRKEAVQAAGRRLAAAEFKAAAAGKIGDPAAALEVLDLSKFVGQDGEPDSTAIQKVVDRLALAMPVQAPPSGRVPAGPRSDSDESPDFIRTALRGRG
jgi:hypothetical protein